MSHNARTLLEGIVSALNTMGVRINTPGRNELIVEFANRYDPVVYEDAVLGWQGEAILKYIRNHKGFSCKRVRPPPDDEILITACLTPLFNNQWDNIPQSQYRQFMISNSAKAVEVYEYITTQYLGDDFSFTDLQKISQIAKDHSLAEVTEKCVRVSGVDKRHVGYLYAILKNEAKIEKARTEANTVDSNRTVERINHLLESQRDTGFRAQRDPNWIEDAKIVQQMLEDEELSGKKIR